MLPYREHRFGTLALGIFFVLLLGYAVYEFYATAMGPHITLPSDTITVHEAYTLVRGQAKNISELHMNGTTITVTEDGVFEEPYVLNPGKNTVVFDARDNYGRKSREVLQILYVPHEASTHLR